MLHLLSCTRLYESLYSVNTKMYKDYTKVDLFNGRLFAVDSERQENLAGYVKRIRDAKGLTVQKVAERSRGGIAQAYVSKIENGGVKNVSPEKLKALAKGLGVPEDELFRIARGIKVGKDENILKAAAYISELPPERQEDAIAFLELMYQRYKKSEVGKPKEASREKESKSNKVVGVSESGNLIVEVPELDQDETLPKKGASEESRSKGNKKLGS